MYCPKVFDFYSLFRSNGAAKFEQETSPGCQ
jgi:hypothetical protein